MLDSMERDGFLTRRPSDTDRRTGQVSLTDKGKEPFHIWEDQCMTLEEKMLQDFSPEETAQFAEFLARAYRNVGGRII